MRTQILIPASARHSMHSGTPSCRLKKKRIENINKNRENKRANKRKTSKWRKKEGDQSVIDDKREEYTRGGDDLIRINNSADTYNISWHDSIQWEDLPVFQGCSPYKSQIPLYHIFQCLNLIFYPCSSVLNLR